MALGTCARFAPRYELLRYNRPLRGHIPAREGVSGIMVVATRGEE